jgi:hypothetical protein
MTEKIVKKVRCGFCSGANCGLWLTIENGRAVSVDVDLNAGKDLAGRVFLSKLNIPMMSKMFGGAVGAAMTQVGSDEQQIIRALTT